MDGLLEGILNWLRHPCKVIFASYVAGGLALTFGMFAGSKSLIIAGLVLFIPFGLFFVFAIIVGILRCLGLTR